jgi:hypothetical protein
MPLPGSNSQAEARSGFLPLFRREALAAQDRTHGEILLIRPFSLMFFTWLLLGIAAAGIGFLVAGHYDETARVSASLTSDDSLPASSPRAVFYIPSRARGLMPTGTPVSMQWQSCAGQQQRIAATVIQVAPAALDEIGIGGLTADGNVPFRVTVALSAESSAIANSGGRLDAEIPLGRKPLIHWLFARNKL